MKVAITKAEWDGLNDKAQWDIKVALRGPDVYHAETIKWFTTSVIRGRCRKVFRVGGTVNEDLKIVVLPQGLGRHTHKAGYDTWNSGHFIEHVYAAASWLNIPVLYIPAEDWFKAMREEITDAGQLILKAAEKPVEGLKIGPSGEALKKEVVAELHRHLNKGHY